MNLFHKPEPPFSWRGKAVTVRIGIGDSESFYQGTLEALYSDGLLLKTSTMEIFIPRGTVISIERDII
jgi:hypothetical protein